MNIMKKLIIVVLFLVGFSTYAQEENVPKNRKDRYSKEMKSLEQKNSIK